MAAATSTLIPSAARRGVLDALYGDGRRDSIHALAQRTALPYAAVHREVEALLAAGLAREERRGRARIVAAADRGLQAAAIAQLVAAARHSRGQRRPLDDVDLAPRLQQLDDLRTIGQELRATLRPPRRAR